MAELSTIARPYAEALFETARVSGEGLERWLAAVEELAALMSHPQVAQVVADPKLGDAQVVDLLAGLVKQ
ncbi:MAG TPA: F0F1 ATP synthase subunit delta, partial [Thiobacillaceae bacterium]